MVEATETNQTKKISTNVMFKEEEDAIYQFQFDAVLVKASRT